MLKSYGAMQPIVWMAQANMVALPLVTASAAEADGQCHMFHDACLLGNFVLTPHAVYSDESSISQALISRQCSQEALYLCQPTCFICCTSRSLFLTCRQAASRGDGSCSAAQLRSDQHFPATEHCKMIWPYTTLAHSPPSDFLSLLCCHALHELPNFSPEDISNSIWALATLKHANIVLACSALPCFISNWVVSVPPWTGLHVCASCMCVLPA